MGQMINAIIEMYCEELPGRALLDWLMALFLTVMCCCINILTRFDSNFMSGLQFLAMFLHIGGFIITVTVLWVLGPRVSPVTTLTEFSNEGGYSNLGLAIMVGQLSAVVALSGSDAPVHMSEEAEMSSSSVPRAIFWTFFFNGALGIVAMFSFLCAIPSVTDAANDPSGFSMMYVFALCGGRNSALCLATVQIVMLLLSSIGLQAATARQTLAFARDGGLPCSAWLAEHDYDAGDGDASHQQATLRSILISGVFTIIITSINLVSTDAFDAILSLQAVAQMTTYILSIGCLLHRRYTEPETIPKAQWSLGNKGTLINSIALAFACYIWFWIFWPAYLPVTAKNMNWAGVMFFATVGIAMVYFVFKARKTYNGPVDEIKPMKDMREG